MVTAELSRPRATALPAPAAGRSGRSTIAPKALLGSLWGLVAFAAFSGGATADPTETRLQVAVAVIAALSAGAALLGRDLTLQTSRSALAGLAALAGFAVWSGVSLLWSASPDATWIACNRAVSYVVVVMLALCVGSSHPRAVRSAASGLLLVTLAVGLYALGQKVIPGLRVGGLIDLDRTGVTPRLRSPLDYWNALALFICLGVPIALALAVDRSRRGRVRLAALLALPLLLLPLALTLSRGGILGLAVALVTSLAVAGADRLRAMLALAIATAALLPALVFALTDGRLTGSYVLLGRRETAGAVLGLILAASLAALHRGGRWLLARESANAQMWAIGPKGRRMIRVVVAGVVLAGIAALALSPRGLPGTISHAWRSFTTPRAATVLLPDRFVSVNSGNRWVWWKEAVGAFSDRPLTGWGAGSFPVLDRLYRTRSDLAVRQPHSMPLEYLAETGLPGAGLALGGLAVLLLAAGTAARKRPVGPERTLAAAILAGGVAYALHSLYDWDWDIPGVTLPVLVGLGVLAGGRWGKPVRDVETGGGASSHRLSPWRVGAAAASGLAMAAYALSAALPSLSADRAREALVAGASRGNSSLRAALATAEVSARLDPLSTAGLEAAATITLHAGDLGGARSYLLRAVRRAPDDVSAWEELAVIEGLAHDPSGLRDAAAHVLTLDPRGPSARNLLASALAALAPADGSATAAGTPLPSA